MEVNRESVFLRNENYCYIDTVSGEGKTDIESNNVSKILGIYVKSVNTEGEIVENTIKYKSGIIYSICYIDNEKNIRKSEVLGEICGEIKGVSSNGSLHIDIIEEKVEADISTLKLIIKGIFKVEATIVECKKTDYISSSDSLIVKKEDCEYYKSYGRRKTVFPLEEEFTLGYSISNVLMHKIVPIITAVQCGVGCIIVDGEVHISAVLLQNNEKRDIIKEEKTLPFRAEIDYEEAMPSMIAVAEVFEKSFKTDVNVDETSNQCTVNATISLLLEGEAFSVVSSSICNDAFSLTNELETKISVETKVTPKEQRQYNVLINSQKIAVDGVNELNFILCSYENAIISETKRENDCIKVYGVCEFTAFFKSQEGEIVTRRIESPFETEIKQTCSPFESFLVKCKIISVKPKQFISGEIEVEYNLSFTLYCEQIDKVKLLQEVTEGEIKKTETSSISVYISMPNEDLWSLSKRLNTPPDEIIATNNQLQFPLSGKERIIVYRQKK